MKNKKEGESSPVTAELKLWWPYGCFLKRQHRHLCFNAHLGTQMRTWASESNLPKGNEEMAMMFSVYQVEEKKWSILRIYNHWSSLMDLAFTFTLEFPCQGINVFWADNSHCVPGRNYQKSPLKEYILISGSPLRSHRRCVHSPKLQNWWGNNPLWARAKVSMRNNDNRCPWMNITKVMHRTFRNVKIWPLKIKISKDGLNSSLDIA